MAMTLRWICSGAPWNCRKTTGRGCLATYRFGDFIVFACPDNEAVYVYHDMEGLTPKPAWLVWTMDKGSRACTKAQQRRPLVRARSALHRPLDGESKARHYTIDRAAAWGGGA